MKLIFIFLFFSINFLYAQNHTFKIDTVYISNDSTVVFVKEFIDSTLMKSYFGMFTDSTDEKVKYGFLHLKKATLREYKIKKPWDIKEYNWSEKYPGIRDLQGEPVIMQRIE